MIINIKNYMIMIFSYSNADDKVKISKFRDGKYYMDSIESVGIKSDSSLEELTAKGLRVKAELYDRKDNCIYDTRLIVELVEDSRVEVMQA